MASEQILMAILILMMVVIFILVAVLIFILWKFVLHQNHHKNQEKDEPPKKSQELDIAIENCAFHPEIQAQGICAISGTPICELCIREDDGIIISAEYFRMYNGHTWVGLETVLTTPDTTEASSHLYTFKKWLWDTRQTPTFISTHYKINVSDDFIESHVTLHARDEEAKQLLVELEQHKKSENLNP